MRRVTLVIISGLFVAALLPGAEASAAGAFQGPVPRAECGPGSRPEPALQGEVTVADRQSGRSAQGYTCNLELVGNYRGEGTQWQFAGYGHCAYYGTRLHGTEEKRGTVVVDASDPTRPRLSTNLTSPAMLDSWESLKVHEGRGLLAGVLGSGPVPYGGYFDVYDVAGDCAHPKLLASLPVNGLGHEGEWAPDGRTYYATGFQGPGSVTAIDVSVPEKPRMLTTFLAPGFVHGLGVSLDGNRLYLAHVNEDWAPAAFAGDRDSLTTSNGLGIYDVSEIEARRTQPRVRPVSRLGWNDGAIGQHAVPITSHGEPYVVFVDEFHYGGPRIIDIADERHPRLVSRLRLEIQMPEHREVADREALAHNNENGGVLPFGYNSHYCNPDRLVDPTILACSNFESGIRVFDIRDVTAPKEIAYFNPGGDGTRAPASWGGTTSGYTSAKPRIVTERGEIWFTDQDRGFYIVRFTNDVWPSR